MLKHRLLYLLLIFTCVCHAFAQPPSKAIEPKTAGDYQTLERNHKRSDDDCIFNDKFSLAARLSKYPFSKAVKIAVVSYPSWMSISINEKYKDGSFKEGLHVIKGKLYRSSIKEYVTLNTSQRDNLTNIIFNTAFRKTGYNEIEKAACFDPRNAILFYDNRGQIFDYIEICFECKNDVSFSKKIDIGTLCNQKYDMLKKFLIDVGLKHGTQILD